MTARSLRLIARGLFWLFLSIGIIALLCYPTVVLLDHFPLAFAYGALAVVAFLCWLGGV